MSLLLYRLSNARRAGDLSGEGARRAGGRWNQRFTPALYTASTVSLGLLEVLVHLEDLRLVPGAYSVTVIKVNDPGGRLQTVDVLPTTMQDAQELGTALLSDPEVLGYWVPSVIVPRERNLVLNPAARAFQDHVHVEEVFELAVDERLRQQ